MAFLSDQTLRAIAAGLGPGWRQIGTHLNVEWNEIMNIESDFPRFTEDAIFQMLYKWRQRTDQQTSLKKLRVALIKGGERLLCDKILPLGKLIKKCQFTIQIKKLSFFDHSDKTTTNQKQPK